MHRLSLRTAAALVLATLASAAIAQDPYPERPVTLVVPTAASGGTDTIARYFADRLGRALKQPFVVDNKPGGNGVLGTDIVAHAPPDGYKLLFTYTAAHVVNPAMLKKLPYDPVKDLTPIVQIGRGGNLLLVNPKLPIKNLQEFVAYVKARPGKLNYCSWGTGSGGHLTMESLKKQAGLDITHVPYKGSGPCAQDVIGGQVEAGWADVSSTVELVRAGRVRAIATSGPVRVPQLPDVPTLTQAGYPFTAYSWYGLFAPTGTPPAVVERLNTTVLELMREPATVQRMREFNFTDLPLTTPEQFAETVRVDAIKWGELVRSLNLQAE